MKLRRHGLGQLAAKKRKVRVVAAAGARLHHGPERFLGRWSGHRRSRCQPITSIDWSAGTAPQKGELLHAGRDLRRTQAANKFKKTPPDHHWGKKPANLHLFPPPYGNHCRFLQGVVLDCWNAANCPVRATRSTEARHSAPRASGRSTRSVSWWNDTRGARPGRERDRRQARHRAYATGHVERIVRKVYARSGPVLTNPVRRWWLTRTRRVGPWRDSSDKVRCSLERLEQRIMGPKKTKKNSE